MVMVMVRRFRLSTGEEETSGQHDDYDERRTMMVGSTRMRVDMGSSMEMHVSSSWFDSSKWRFCPFAIDVVIVDKPADRMDIVVDTAAARVRVRVLVTAMPERVYDDDTCCDVMQ